MQAEIDISTNTPTHHQNNIESTQYQNNLQTQQNAIESPNIHESSPYSSIFHSRDMIGLSPINNTSPSRTNHDVNERQTTIDLTTQSPIM
jgi:hypothetical protein